MRLTDHSARSAPTACWDGLRGTVRCSSVAAVEQALPKSRARAGGHGIVLILRACDWSKYLDFLGLWARVHCRIVVLKSAKSRKKTSGYHRQGRVENAFFRYKSIIGDGLRARSPAGQGSEVVLGCEILNRMTALGRPVSYRIDR